MSSKKYLILGGNGFIGKNLCEYIVNKGDHVTSFDREFPEERMKKIEYVRGDFFSDDFLRETVCQYDIIVHAISTINPGNSNECYMNGYGRDLVQTVKMCTWIKDTDKKVLFLSSGGTVYGDCKIQPIKEDTLPKPINHYGNVKLCIENALRIFHIQNRLNIRIARISNPYGPGQDFRKGVGFIDAVLKQALGGQQVEIWGDGENIRDYIYIQDVCGALYALSKYEGDEYLFNVSSNTGISQNQVIEEIEKLGISVQVTYKPRRSVDARKIILDNKKILSIYNDNLLSFHDGLEKYYKYLVEKRMKE